MEKKYCAGRMGLLTANHTFYDMRGSDDLTSTTIFINCKKHDLSRQGVHILKTDLQLPHPLTYAGNNTRFAHWHGVHGVQTTGCIDNESGPSRGVPC